MPEINLLQNQLKDTTLASSRRTKYAVLGMSILLIIMAGIGTLLFLKTKSVNTMTADLLIENNKYKNEILEADKGLTAAKTYQAQLANMDLLLKKHVLISGFLEELGKTAYPQMQYLSMDVQQETGKIHLSGVVDSYEGIGKVLLGLSTSQHFENVKLLTLAPAGNSSGFAFSIDLNATADIFANK